MEQCNKASGNGVNVKNQIFNPYLPSCEYIPDGEPRVFEDRLYIYGSHDKFNGSTYCENDYVCWSAPLSDLSDFRYEGIIYKKSSHPYKTKRGELFAPDVVRGVDGRYYLYYSMAHSSVISVAVSDTPSGEYTYLSDVQFKDGRLLGNRTGDYYQFDPAVLVDDDNRIYMYSGFNPDKEADENGIIYAGCHVCELESDMYTVKVKPKLIINKHDYKEYDAQYFEAPSIRKINSIYYLVYSVRCGGLHYCYSKYPDRGYVYGGRIHSTSDVGIDSFTVEKPAYPVGNTHGGIAFINGSYYIFDHRLTNNSSYCRQGVAEKIIIEKNGHIKQKEATSCGLNNAPLDGSGTYPSYIACNLIDRNVHKDKNEIKEKRMCITQDAQDWDFELEKLYDGNNKEGYERNTIDIKKQRPVQYIHNVHNDCTVGFKYFNIKNIKSITLKVKGSAKGKIIITSKIDKLDFEKIGHEESVNKANLSKDLSKNILNDILKYNLKDICGISQIHLSGENIEKIDIPVNMEDGINPLYITFTGDGMFDFYEFEILC